MNKKERVLNAMKLKNVDRIPMMYRGTIPFSKKLMRYFGIGNKDDQIFLLYI